MKEYFRFNKSNELRITNHNPSLRLLIILRIKTMLKFAKTAALVLTASFGINATAHANVEEAFAIG